MDLKERSTNPNRHPWELSRADMMLRLIDGHTRATRYADVGSGDLYFAERIADTTDAAVYAVDVHYRARSTVGQVVVCTDVEQVPPDSVDCALLMDVLEHVDDDVHLLRQIERILAPGGQIVITVPAHAFLWSAHDMFLGHRRRYSRAQLCAVLKRADLDISECFYFYGLPFVARTLAVALSRLGAGEPSPAAVGRWAYPPEHVLTRVLRSALNGDFRLSRLVGALPIPSVGLSLCALCRPASA